VWHFPITRNVKLTVNSFVANVVCRLTTSSCYRPHRSPISSQYPQQQQQPDDVADDWLVLVDTIDNATVRDLIACSASLSPCDYILCVITRHRIRDKRRLDVSTPLFALIIVFSRRPTRYSWTTRLRKSSYHFDTIRYDDINVRSEADE